MTEFEESEDFDNIPKGLWFALVSLTTVGYGDVTPNTVEGKMVASTAICVGVVLMAGPVAVMSTNFSKCYQENRRMEKHRRDVEKHRQHVNKMAKMRGKQAFGENLKMVLKESMDKAMSLVAYRRFMQVPKEEGEEEGEEGRGGGGGEGGRGRGGGG